MPEDQNNQEPQQHGQPPAPTGAPVAPEPPVAPGAAQPQGQSASQSQGAGKQQVPAGQSQEQGQDPNQQRPQNPQQPQPTFRPNGAFSFFATPSDPDDDPAPMSIGFKLGWLVLGLIGGMLGLVMAFISTTTLSAKRRRQALLYTWIGFAIQAVVFLIFTFTGATFPLGGVVTTAPQTTTGSASAFG